MYPANLASFAPSALLPLPVKLLDALCFAAALLGAVLGVLRHGEG